MIKFILTLLAATSLLVSGCQRMRSQPLQPSSVNRLNESLLEAHNKERSERLLPRLKLNDQLNEIAQRHAVWMADHRILKHQSMNNILSQNQTRLSQYWRTAGENIACGQTTVVEVMQSWMRSSGHRRNILNHQFTHIGLGKATDRNDKIYWCVVFAG